MPLFAILTLFPEALEPYLGASILGLARERGLIRVLTVDFRDFTRDRHRTVDDRPFGGGPGMVLRPEPIAECVEWLETRYGSFQKLALCPSGRRFDQARATALSQAERVLLFAGRYEGFDERVIDELGFERLSLGDFVLSGGELPALCVVEAAARLIPGVLGDEESARRDSFGAQAHLSELSTAASEPSTAAWEPSTAAWEPSTAAFGKDAARASEPPPALDHPHFTRPRVWRGKEVPPVLLSGNHAEIERWRRAAALAKTRTERPDLAPRPAPRGPQQNTPHPKNPNHHEGDEPTGLEQRHAPDRAH